MDLLIKIDNFKMFDELQKNEEKIYAVYFYKAKCLPCKALEPLLSALSELFEGRMEFLSINFEDLPEIANKYNIKSFPTVLFLKNGEEQCSRLSGYISAAELRKVCEGVIEGYCPVGERPQIYSDVIILGSGPAGLTAAIYASRSKLCTVVIDEGMVGGQVATTYTVENYPGTGGEISGFELMEKMKMQALHFGTRIDELKHVLSVELNEEKKYVKTQDADYYAKVLIIATGAQPRKLPVDEEKDYRGKGIHYCATCDGALYSGTEVFVVGGGNSAVEEAGFLTRFVDKVTIIHHKDKLQASKAGQELVFENPKISIIWDTKINKIIGDNFMTGVVIENVKTGDVRELSGEGVFVYIGLKPETDMFKDLVFVNDRGYIVTNEDMQTNISGVFAIGDVRSKKVRQISTAVGDGTIAGIMAEKYIGMLNL